MPVILASLYWGEGKKRGGFLFTNTDEKMIKVFMKILRNYFYIKDENIQAVVRICDPMDPSECIKYWKNVTNLSLENIKLNRNNRQNKSKTKYGMCRIIIKKGGYMLKLTSCLITEMAHKINTT